MICHSETGRPDEARMISRFFAPLAGPGAGKLRDDVACLRHGADEQFIVNVDALVANVHFMEDEAPDNIGKKALRVNLSDLISKGAVPYAYFLTLALPKNWQESWLAEFATGLAQDQALYGLHLLGGDTVASTCGVWLSVTMIGKAKRQQLPHRSCARPGDLLYVSGTIGDAAVGLLLAQGGASTIDGILDEVEQQSLVAAYRLPAPPMALSAVIRDYVRAAMDVSDGLMVDAQKMMQAAGVGAVIEQTRIPLSDSVRKLTAAHDQMFDRVVGGGDDYQMLMAVGPDREAVFCEAARAAAVTVTKIGYVIDGQSVSLTGRNGARLDVDHPGYDHFGDM